MGPNYILHTAFPTVPKLFYLLEHCLRWRFNKRRSLVILTQLKTQPNTT